MSRFDALISRLHCNEERKQKIQTALDGSTITDEEDLRAIVQGKTNTEVTSLLERNLQLHEFHASALAGLLVVPQASDEVDYKNFPFYYDVLKKVGMQTPFEQYTLYVSVGAFLYGAYSPIRKAFFLDRWLRETDPSLKDIWAARANLSIAEQKGGVQYLQELKKAPKRYAILPLSFLLIEGIRFGYHQLSSVFSRKRKQ